ncbi:hypothetical protein JW979_13450 [bacterium]|nr:hypothetical protein [candidate division CSSED10-310 bacterium]
MSESNLFDSIEKALISGDLDTAASLIAKIASSMETDAETIHLLKTKIEQVRTNIDNIELLYRTAQKALEHDDPDLALSSFSEILRIIPDHEQARAGFQDARRYKDLRDQINDNLQKVYDAQMKGDFQTAKEKCKEVLLLAPEHEGARQLLKEISEMIAKRRLMFQLMESGKRKYQEEKFDEAISNWEKIADLDPSNNESKEWIAKAKQVIKKRKQDLTADSILRNAQRALFNRDYQQAIEILTDFPSGSSLHIDADVIRRKATVGLENQNLQKDLYQKISKAISEGDLGNADNYVRLLMSIDSESKIAENTRELLKEYDEKNPS